MEYSELKCTRKQHFYVQVLRYILYVLSTRLISASTAAVLYRSGTNSIVTFVINSARDLRYKLRLPFIFRYDIGPHWKTALWKRNVGHY